MSVENDRTGGRVMMALSLVFVLTLGAGMLWLMWRPAPPAPESPQMAAYHARQKAACDVALEAQTKLREKGLEHQAENLDVGSVCDPSRSVRHGLYWLIGSTAALGLFIMLLFAASPRF